MPVLEFAFQEAADHFPDPESLTVFEKHLDAAWIEAALEATGTGTLRRRRLPAEQVVWLVIGMALDRNRPIADVVSALELALPGPDGSPVVASSTVVQARQRLGAEPMKWLFEKTADKWAHRSAREEEWKGLSLYAVDGSSLRASDSEENRAHFTGTKGPRGESGYPLVRVVTLMAVRSHLLAAAEIGPYADSELELCKPLWQHIPDDSLTVLDRNFLAAYILVGAIHSQGSNRHWMTRAKSSSKWNILESFGQNDKLVELAISSEARRQHPELPKTYVARAVRYRRNDSKGEQWVLTSLLDPVRFPRKEVVAVYHERWDIEMGYKEIKTHMLERKESLRSRNVHTTEQEIWGLLLCYNLIRLEMTRMAKEAKVAPNRISFVRAMRFIRSEWSWCAIGTPGSIPKKLREMRKRILEFVLPPRRSGRRYPRVVKVKMSNYAKKRRPTN